MYFNFICYVSIMPIKVYIRNNIPNNVIYYYGYIPKKVHRFLTFWLRSSVVPGVSQVVLVVKNLPAHPWDIRDAGSFPGLGPSPRGEHNNPLQYSCLRILWTEKPGRLQSTEAQRVRHDWNDLACTHSTAHIQKMKTLICKDICLPVFIANYLQ